MEETLKILETINAFYAASFNQLVTITLSILGFVGLVIPLLMTLYQKRMFKIENREIEASLAAKIEERMSQHKKDLDDEYKKKELEFERKISDLQDQLKKEIDSTTGGIYHIQANMLIKEKNYRRATESALRAAIFHFQSKNEKALNRTIKIINDSCFSNLSEKEFHFDPEVENLLDSLIQLLEDPAVNGRYYDQVKKMRFFANKLNAFEETEEA